MLLDEHNTNFLDRVPDSNYTALGNPRRHGRRGGNHWNNTRQPSSGAEQFAFSSLGLPEHSPIGAATAQLQQLSVAEPNLIYVYGKAVPMTGLGGVIAGGFNLQALVDPNQPGA